MFKIVTISNMHQGETFTDQKYLRKLSKTMESERSKNKAVHEWYLDVIKMQVVAVCDESDFDKTLFHASLFRKVIKNGVQLSG